MNQFVAQTIAALIAGQLTETETSALRDAFNVARERKTAVAKSVLKVGQSVKFKDKHGLWYHGSVEKIMQKNVQVKVNNARWRVAASLVVPA